MTARSNAQALVAMGVDGAAGGWVAAVCFAEGGAGAEPEAPRTEVRFFGREGNRGALDALVAWMLERGEGRPIPTAVDVPIGLMELGGSRPCDEEARRRLGGKASSVFNPPGRYLLDDLEPEEEGDYTVVRAAVASRREKEKRAAQAEGRTERKVLGLGAQSAGILPKVREVNEYVRGSARGAAIEAESWLFEVHPELCFDHMRTRALGDASGPPSHLGYAAGLAPKTSARGVVQRLWLVRREFPDVEAASAGVEWPQRHGFYDVLDAYSALWTALRCARADPDLQCLYGPGRSEPLREDGGQRLLMRMVV